MIKYAGFYAFVFSIAAAAAFCADFPTDPPRIVDFLTEQPSLTRVGRELTVRAVVENPSTEPIRILPTLAVPSEVRILHSPSSEPMEIAPDQTVSLRWTVTATREVYAELKLEIRLESADSPVAALERLPIRFLEARGVERSDEIPAPVRPERSSDILVGAHNCPLWNADSMPRWSQLRKHPERTPALGFYNQQQPEVADWETKWAVEHGVDFFIYCWYRAGQGGPVKTRFAEVFDDALFKSRFQNEIKFTIMWENQAKGVAGVSDESDLLDTLYPFWSKNYFQRENYLKMDNKPLLFVYRPEFLVNDLGSVENVRSALDKLREKAKADGFDGLILLGEYRGTDPKPIQFMKELGFDCSFSYCWPIPNSPSPSEAIERQIESVRTIGELDILPQLVTASQAWSGWRDEGTIWKLPPDDFERLLRRMKKFIETEIPADQLGAKMIVLDNWNEWGEGHYLLPYTEYGFGYLDAIAKVFTKRPANHEDLLPGDIGKCGYDAPYRTWFDQNSSLPPDPERWNFDAGQGGWNSMMGNRLFEVSGGRLCLESNSADPAIKIIFQRMKNTKSFSKVRIRMKVSGLDGRKSNAQILWSAANEDWSERKSMTLPLAEDGEFHEYVFDVQDSLSWRGGLAGLRFDYASVPTVRAEIEEIALER